MIALKTDKGGTYPECELLDWTGDAIPTEDELRTITFRKGKIGKWEGTVTRLILLGTKRTVKDRIERLDLTLPPEQPRGPAAVMLWKELDNKLADWFDLA